MRLVFWLDCLSLHQLPYIVHLLDFEKVDDVVIAASEGVSEMRRNMGWKESDYPGLDRCKVYVRPCDEIVESILAERPEESWHFFSGINAFDYISNCLKKSLKYPVKRGVITESPITFALGRPNWKPLWLHKVRFLLQDYRYAKHIDCVFAMGKKAVEYFKSVNDSWKVFSFMYCTQTVDVGEWSLPDTADVKLIFVGSLNKRKSPDTITKAMSICLSADKSFGGKVTFVGDGEKRRPMEQYVKEHHLEECVDFLGYQPIEQGKLLMAQNDILILPSLHDGWGAVVNEALQAGLYVVVSDACGAKDLVEEDPRLGCVFHRGDETQLADIMLYSHSHISEIRGNREFRRQWAEEHISGKVVAKYMIDCLVGMTDSLT